MGERVIAGILGLLAAAGCGRIRFDGRDAVDASLDASSDGITADALDPSLVFWLPLDGDTNDAITGEAATCLNSCPLPVAGKIGTAIGFAGANECLQFAGAGKEPAVFTLALWMTKTVDGDYSYFAKPFDRINDVYNSWQFEDHSDMSFGLTTHNAGRHDVLSTLNAAPGGWHHLAGSFDGTTKRIYIDGTLRMSGPEPDPVQYDTSPVVVGCDINNGAVVYPFTGALDDVRLYNRALTDAEIAVLAQ